MVVTHPFEPVFDQHSRVLVLGTMASPASRENGFYYGHPRNRFWPLMAQLFGAPVPADIAQKKMLLLTSGVALWDVLRVCEITGAADASIRDPRAHDFAPLFAAAPGLRVYANGQTAARFYRRLVYPKTGSPAAALPSTSPANAGCTWKRLVEAWSAIKAYSQPGR